MMFDGKKILITGGTGSLGQALTEKLLTKNVKSIRIFSRDEDKQVRMQERLSDNRISYLIGDVRDKDRLERAIEDIDIVIHAAALKQVPVGEYNPFEFVKTNINGSQNVIDVSMDEEVEVCLGISTDKAVSPLNLYGATKLSMEKQFIAANYYKGNKKTKFSCARYGNVFGSRGSVIPRFIDQIRTKGEISVTDFQMTRFNITMDNALEFIFNSIDMCKGSEVFIPNLKAYRLGDLIDAFKEISSKPFEIKSIPIRDGEKTHEILLNSYEIKYAIESNGYFILLPPSLGMLSKLRELYPGSKTVNLDVYSSDKVPLIEKNELKNILIEHEYIP